MSGVSFDNAMRFLNAWSSVTIRRSEFKKALADHVMETTDRQKIPFRASTHRMDRPLQEIIYLVTTDRAHGAPSRLLVTLLSLF
jgi:hypothetical protein